MKIILAVAHGSRRAESNQSFVDLIENLKSIYKTVDQIIPCFLEIATPLLKNTLMELPSKTTEVIVYPYFLNPGKHVEKDIPSIIADFKVSNPNIKITTLDYFGSDNTIASLIKAQIEGQLK